MNLDEFFTNHSYERLDRLLKKVTAEIQAKDPFGISLKNCVAAWVFGPWLLLYVLLIPFLG